MRMCIVENCGNKHQAKGFCKKHYKSFLRYGDPLQIEQNREQKKHEPKLEVQRKWKQRSREGVCAVEGCSSSIKAKGFCEKHYARVRRTGSLHRGKDLYTFTNSTCLAMQCEREPDRSGYCPTHYTYVHKYGTPHLPERVRLCSSGNCNKPHLAKGLCNTHYKYWKAHDSIQLHQPKIIELCALDNCEELNAGKGLCMAHQVQWEAEVNLYKHPQEA